MTMMVDCGVGFRERLLGVLCTIPGHAPVQLVPGNRLISYKGFQFGNWYRICLR